MPEKYFYNKQNSNKNKETNQDFVISFVKNLMSLNVFSIRKNHNNDKSDKKTDCKY